MKRMKQWIPVLLLLAVATGAACRRPPQGSTVVLIVRHAEKASDAADSPLTEAGVQRARALVGVAAEAGVSAIYTSQFKRSRDTAQPLAERARVALTEMAVDLQNPGDYGRWLAADILEKYRGKTIVVVGHANTVAATAEGLAGHPVALGDVQYSDLVTVIVPPIGPAKIIRAQYGGPAAGNAMMTR